MELKDMFITLGIKNTIFCINGYAHSDFIYEWQNNCKAIFILTLWMTLSQYVRILREEIEGKSNSILQ